MQAEKQSAGTLRFDAIGGKSVHNVEEGDLHIGDVIERRETQFAYLGAAAEFGTLMSTLRITLVKVAKGFATESGRTARNAIGLAMAASGVAHNASKKRANRFSLNAIARLAKS